MTMDDRTVKVWRKEDYSYIAVSASPSGEERAHAEVWVSPASTMTTDEIAAELRRLADFVERRQ